MHAPRRLQALFVVVSFAGASFGVPAGALAQSAGDEQYQDPLAGTTSTGATLSSTTAPKGTSTVPDLNTVPQLSPSPGSPAATGTKVPAPVTVTTLPNTGADGRVMAAIGLGLLLCGIGLRLRTTRERF